jgi:hypothetical protein
VVAVETSSLLAVSRCARTLHGLRKQQPHPPCLSVMSCCLAHDDGQAFPAYGCGGRSWDRKHVEA